jgi:branched-subunit amino acid aminotransferase/4-amino-4-deoxychorismate lyase
VNADALFVTNSIAGILPVRKVLDRPLDIPETMLSAMMRTLESENRAQE